MTKAIFHWKKFQTNQAKVAKFLGLATISKATFEKVAELIIAKAEWKGQGSTPGSTMYVAETTQGFMITSVVPEGFWTNGTNGVSLYGHYQDEAAGIKTTRVQMEAWAKRKGLEKI